MRQLLEVLVALSAQARKEVEEIVEERLRERVASKEEFRTLTATVERLGGIVERLGQVQVELAEAQKRTEARVEELAEAQKRTEARVEELAEAQKRTEARVEELASVQLKTALAVNRLERTVDRLGARWGIYAEETFRNAMKSLLSRRFGATVEETQIGGRQVDLIIRNGRPVIVQITSSTRRKDIETLIKNGKRYSETHGVTADLMLVTAFVSPALYEFARQAGIEIQSHE